MIRREVSASVVNALLARDFAGIDATDFLANPMNVCLVEDGDGALFVWRGLHTFEVHVFYASRGRAALDRSRRFLDVMRADHEARHFWALVPVGSRRVAMFTRLMAWASHGIVETQHGPNELFTSENDPCPQP